MEAFKHCRLCPRNCGVDRTAGEKGFCGEGAVLRAARAARHDWEEPCISGDRGSGAIFFSGCSLGCVYCQNTQISKEGHGKEITVERLRDIMEELVQSGVHNINLVTGTHFAPLIAKALEKPLAVPVVWNSGGYESLETLRMLEGKVQIYLPDLKYMDKTLAEKYSFAPDYPEVATAAIEEMYRQVGSYWMDEEGILQRGLIIRHLQLPGALDNTLRVLDWVGDRFGPGEVLLSLMSQYVSKGGELYPELGRALTEKEYAAAEKRLYALGIQDGFLQELEAADPDYVPAFDFQGI